MAIDANLAGDTFLIVSRGGNQVFRAKLGADGKLKPRWLNYETVIGMPYDFPIAGYGNNTVNNLRLWTAKAPEEFDLEFFNNGDYIKAYERKTLTENITKILYPNDKIDAGRELRVLRITGPGADHAVHADCPEGLYLKVVLAQALSRV